MVGRKRRGFTLIELLVVVAIIALLISILLPSLSRAREQAKIAVCLANLKSIGTAAASYAGENKEDFPWALKSQAPYTFTLFSELVWGGGIPNFTQTQANQWKELTGTTDFAAALSQIDVFRVPPRLRPMNKYLSPDVSWDAEPNTNVNRSPTEIPEFFRCPSDSSAQVPSVTAPNPPVEADQATSTWEYWGNSYAINWYWPYYYYKAPPGNAPPYNSGFLSIIGVGTPPGLGQRMMRVKGGRFAAEFTLFMENGLNYVLEGARPPGYTANDPWVSDPRQIVGWHKQFSKHSSSFLDGHAAHMTFDTRFNFGTGWTTWPNKPWEGTWAAFNDNVPTP